MTARRLPGEGSISQEPDGSWKWRVTNGKKPDGKPNVIVRRAQTVTELEEKIKKVRAELNAGVKTSGKKITVEEWLREWIEDIRAIAAAPKTLEGYRADARNYINPVIGKEKLYKLTTQHVNRVYAAMVAKGLAPASVHHCHRTLRAALETAVEHKKIGFNPAVSAEQPPAEEFEISPLTREESMQVLKEARALRNGARWRVALSLGLRSGEALALQVNDIDFKARRLHVRRQVQRIAWRHGCPDVEKCTHEVKARGGGKKTVRRRGCDCPQRQGPGGLVVRATKGKRSRTIAIPEGMFIELVEQVETLKMWRSRAKSLWKQGPGGGWLFPAPTGGLTDPRKDYGQWVTLLDAAGVRRVRRQPFRRAWRSLCRRLP